MRRSLTLVLLLASATTEAAGGYLNPGTLGPNALPPEPCETPWVGDGWIAEVGLGVQNAQGPRPPPPSPSALQGFGSPENGPQDDPSATVPFRLEYPFARRASLMVEGTPVELWFLSASTQAAWGTPHGYGIAKGDIRIGGKFLLFPGKAYWPAVAIRTWVKTTTGKAVDDHRFINAPGYEFDAIFGERLPLSSGFALELWAAAGFLAWQQGFGQQNDAPDASATLSLVWATGTALRFQYQGFWGWEQHDKPQALGAVLELPLRAAEGALPAVTVVIGLTRSLRDPPYTGFRFGVRVGSVGEPPLH